MTIRLLIIVGAVSYVLAWLLPAYDRGKSMVRGWGAFWLTMAADWPNKSDPYSEWYGSLLRKASALSNLVLAGALLDFFLNAGRAHPVFLAPLAASAVLNTQWFLTQYRTELRIGYYLWAGSFCLTAVGMAVTGGVAASRGPTLTVISATAVFVGIYVTLAHNVSRTETSVTDDSKRRQYRDAVAGLNRNTEVPDEDTIMKSDDTFETKAGRRVDAPESKIPGHPIVTTTETEKDNWGTDLVRLIVQPIALGATPIFLLLLTGYFVVRAFQEDLYFGIRSLCGALLPLILMTFIHRFKKEFLVQLGSARVSVGFVFSLFWGFGLMLILQVFNLYLHIKYVPLNELVLSGSFSVLVFTYLPDEQNTAAAYYYGMITGFLIYICLFGFPIDVFHR